MRPPGTWATAPGRRLAALMTAGLVDSLFLSIAWTVVVLQVAATRGLAAVGVCTAAALVGVVLSAAVTGRASSHLSGRALLRTAAGVEGVLRVVVFVMAVVGAPVAALAVGVALLGTAMWTGYAAMRAEVAAVSPGARALTWYGTTVAALEAVGVGIAALLPLSTGTGWDPLLVAVLGGYALGLVPTALVAAGSPVACTPRTPRPARAVLPQHRSAGRPRSAAEPVAAPRHRSAPALRGAGARARAALAAERERWDRRFPTPASPGRHAASDATGTAGARRPPVTAPAGAGAVLMLLASGPALLAVALAEQLHGRSAVALAALALTAGALAAPLLAGWVQRSRHDPVVLWTLCATGMVAGWVAAPWSVAALCLAQVLAGLTMTALEGLLDSAAAELRPDAVTAALARATAARALGSAAATAALPLAVAGAGTTTTAAVLTETLLMGAVVLAVVRRTGRAAAPRSAEPVRGLAGRAPRRSSAPVPAAG